MESSPLGHYLRRSERRQLCSGGCPFFVAEYLDGRKVPGIGTCLREACDASVLVGTRCLWLSGNPRRVAAVAPAPALAAASA